MLMQNFGVTKKEHYGMLWYFLEWSIILFTKAGRKNTTKAKITNKMNNKIIIIDYNDLKRKLISLN